MTKIKLAVLIGGGGRLPAVYHATKDPNSKAEICLVISFKRYSAGIDFAQAHNLKAAYCRWADYKKQNYSRAQFDEVLLELLKTHNIDLVVLAGWGLLLSPNLVRTFEGRMINVHPALLTNTLQTETTLEDGRTIPVLRGNNAVELALEKGLDTTGCTVHYVTEEMDVGKVILKKEVPILPSDTLESLYERVHAAEDEILPQALEIVCAELIAKK
jgi:phosphoribosylglycinamide formyltransferase-1